MSCAESFLSTLDVVIIVIQESWNPPRGLECFMGGVTTFTSRSGERATEVGCVTCDVCGWWRCGRLLCPIVLRCHRRCLQCFAGVMIGKCDAATLPLPLASTNRNDNVGDNIVRSSEMYLVTIHANACGKTRISYRVGEHLPMEGTLRLLLDSLGMNRTLQGC